ncbi:enoyl-[acyl-carrier protein] reductase II [Paenibacillus taihuensis]|uniref:Enoyl-[acyl-carrier protein] reductase II n=1 Tax=Paenibacillus taihuensis TaxID=1156355 RepID=A0A3D9SCS8_9BACL|nr:enoyl-[acyl-carrier protein] reductase II [Paenibacillus taihuensis]
MKWSTRLTELLGIQYPIIQGGLAYLGYADLAAAISNAGGLGQITGMSLPNASVLFRLLAGVSTSTANTTENAYVVP